MELDGYLLTPGSELRARRARFQAALAAGGIDAALIVQLVDLFYLTGAAQSGTLLVPAVGNAAFLVRKSVGRVREESDLDPRPLRSLRELPSRLAEHGVGPGSRVGLELDVMPAAQYLQLAALLSDYRLVDCSALLRRIRSVKSAWEIERFRVGARRSAAMYDAVPAVLREGIREVELAAGVEAAGRRAGHQGLVRSRGFNQSSYYGAIVAGESGAVVSFGDSSVGGRGVSPSNPLSAGWRPIGRGEPVMVDYVMVSDGYHVDRTRVYSVGPLADAPRGAYEAMVVIQAELAAMIRPGATAGAIYDHAVARARDLGYGDGFLGHGEGKVRFVGHGLGLELDELPVLAAGVTSPLEPGMVVAVEPKVVMPGVGIVGVEHDWLVTETGAERLTLGDDEIVEV